MEYFHCPKNPLCSTYSSFPLLHQLLETIDLVVASIVLPFPECHIAGITQMSDWILSLSNMYLRFFQFFSRLDSSFFLALNSIQLSTCTTIYLSIYLLKDILVASTFWQLWIKLLPTSMCRFFCGHKFSTPLGKWQGVWLLDCMVGGCSVLKDCQTVFQSDCVL